MRKRTCAARFFIIDVYQIWYPLALLLEVGRVFVLDEVMVMVQEEQRQRCTSPQRLQSSFQLVVGQSELF